MDKYQVKCIRESDGYLVFNNEVGNVTEYPCPLSLDECTQYFWRVRAHNSMGWGIYSPKAYFRTPCCPPPPVIISPKNYQPTTTTPRLSWNPVSTTCPNMESDKYRIEIYNSNGILMRYVMNISDEYYDVPSGLLAANKIYHWRVRARNSYCWGDWSDFAYFVTSL